MKRSATYIIDGWEDELRRSLYGSAAGRVGEPTIIMGLQDLTGHRGSARKILDASTTAMMEMGIEEACCFLALVTDNPNVMKSFRASFVKKYPWIIPLACWVHQLNTLVGEICSYAAAKAALGKANRIVTFFNGSHYWGGQLKIAARAEKVTRGLKKNCESRWYAVILLTLSVSAHQTPLSILVARPDARKPTDGCSAVNVDVIRIIQDIDDTFWPWITRVIRVARPFVDAIAASEGRSVSLADCMLNLLGAARQLSVLETKDDDTAEFQAFQKHAHAVVDKRFRQMATPVHRLALFLHPLCRKFAVVDAPGFTLRDYRRTALQIAEKWGWTEEEGAVLASDMVKYEACREPFAGGQKDALKWWETNSASAKDHGLKPFATAMLGIVPHSAEIERLFSSCNGIQSPKRNSLAVETFSKLAKVRSSLVEEAKRRAPIKARTKKTSEPAAVSESTTSTATRMTTENSAPLERSEALEGWQAPMEGVASESEDRVSGVDAVFNDLERRLQQEEDSSDVDEEEEEENTPDVSTLVAAAMKKQKKPSELSLMGGDIYDFALVKKALDNVVPQEDVKKVDVVRKRTGGAWNIEAML
ncbi:ribonuclease H-like domain-containing protein [Mycena pura]|uniref:Ribonuclease H-like domain-containing protein n=1 Tax=Mycena pura TaxID=153505 RepID=A0AAD6YVT9_9AGAR|nr:ribonuclease H-like domain-containing protein [Mycena pura]